MSATPIYQLGYFVPNMTIGSNLDLDKDRFTTIENQLYNIYNIFGNGIVDQYDTEGNAIPTWLLTAVPNQQSVQISPGVGHIAYVYAQSTIPVIINLVLPGGFTTGTFIYYFYATQTSTTPIDQSVNFVALLTQNTDTVNYVGLGAAQLIINTDATYTITVYNDSAHGRQDISLLASVTSLVKNHVHTGGLNEPSPINLALHVTGFLSSNNMGDIDASLITSGTLNPNQLPLIDHNSLLNIGTLTHTQIDALLAAIESSQSSNLSYYGIVNRLQIILALKRQPGLFNIDGEQFNSIFYLPYTDLAGFVDTTNTTAIVNTSIHRVYGIQGAPIQSDVIKINSTQDFKTALFYAEDSIVYPSIQNIVVTGVTTISVAGTINNPYGLSGSISTIYVANSQDSFVSSFSTTGTYINRRNNFDPFLDLNSPLGLWYDSINNYLYIADTFNHRIIITDGTLTNLIAKIGSNNGSGIPGPGQGNGFYFPKGIYGFGNTFYISDSGNNQIQKYIWQNSLPVYQTTYQFPNITGIYQPLNDPRGLIATSFNGYNFLFVSDYNNHRVLCGVETSGIYSIYEILGDNSAGLGISNTNYITYSPTASVTGTNASFAFSRTLNSTISTIGIANSGSGYNNLDSFNFNYLGVPIGLFYVLTDGAGHATTAYTAYGISTTSIYGFDHPQGLALTSFGNRLDLLITDTDNDRVVEYHALSSVGLGTTGNQFVYSYSFGTTGNSTDTSQNIYFERPAGIYAQQGFNTIFVADSLNNRIHSLSTSFASNTIYGISTLVFGIGDSTLTSGGITLDIPTSYLGISTAFSSGSPPSGWYVGEVITQGTQYQADIIDRYNYYILSNGQSLTIQDTVAIAIATLNETTSRTLGEIDCYFIFNNNYSGGTVINFNLSNNSFVNSIWISNLVQLRLNGSAVSQLFEYESLGLFTNQPYPIPIIGFGFKWSTNTGWTNNDAYMLGFYIPSFNSSTLNILYPTIATYRQEYGLTDSIFVFNAHLYASNGTFVFRYDSGPSGNAQFYYAIFDFSTPVSPNGNSSINFSYRTGNTLDQLNSDSNFLPYSFDPNLGIISGEALQITQNSTGRYIDLIFGLNSNGDQLANPTVSSMSLYFSVYGQNTGAIYDTNINNAQIIQYPRLTWSQGISSNISIVPASNNNTQSYQIEIANTSNIGDWMYLSPNDLRLSNQNIAGLVDIYNLYLSPFQTFATLSQGLLNPQHFYSIIQTSGYFIADTDNDRVIQVNANGELVNAIQGNIRLTRCDRDFVILGVYYNSNTKQLYATFSQYVIFGTNYTQFLSIYANGETYAFTNASYFDQVNVGLLEINANNQSATFYVNVTTSMDAVFLAYSNSCTLQIQNPIQNPPFNVPSTGRSDGNSPENESITYSTAQFNEFVYNSVYGIGTVLDYTPSVTINVIDPTIFGNNTNTPSTVLWCYYPLPNYDIFYSIPVQVFSIYFSNIFKPIHIDYTDTSELIISTVGNNSIRTFDNTFTQSYQIGLNLFTFNEKLGGSTVVLDRSSADPGNVLLVAQPSNGISTIVGSVYVYNRSTGTVLNQYLYDNYDAVKSYSINNGYLVLLYDRPGNGLRSKLIQIGQDGQTNYSLTNIFTKPVSLNIAPNNDYYVTDTAGQYGTLYFRTFAADGSGSTIGSGTSSGNTGSGPSGGGTGTSGASGGGGISGGNTGSGPSGGGTGTSGASGGGGISGGGGQASG